MPFGNYSARATPALLTGLIVILSLFWQQRWGTISDTSWLITVCERLLNGQKLYVDVIETNPPFTVWLYMPPVALAHWFGVAPEAAVHAYTLILVLFGLGLAGFVARRANFAENPVLLAFSPAVVALFVLFPGNAFSEREHIGVALLLPLLALMAWRMTQDGGQPGWGLAAAAGLCASLLVLVKPYYAIVILAPAVAVAWRKRSLWPLFALEYWVIALACCLYVAAVLLFFPEFFRDIYPVLSDTYLRMRRFAPIFTTYGPAFAFGLFLIWRLRPASGLPETAIVCLTAGLAAMVPLVFQGKGWPYHAFPAIALAAAALFCTFAKARVEAPVSDPGELRRLALMGAAFVVVSWTPFGVTQKPDAAFIARIRQAVDHPTVALVGSDISAGHPLSRMIGGQWISVHNSDWLGAFAYYLGTVASAENDAAKASHYQSLLDGYIALKRSELETARPDLLIVQNDDPQWKDRLLMDAPIAALYATYHQLAADKTVTVLIRNDYAPPPVADKKSLTPP